MFEFEDAAKASTDDAIGRKLIYSVVSNPIYTALIITIVMMMIVMYSRKDPWSKKFKIGFWIFVINLGILWLHDKVLIEETTVEKKQEEVAGAFDDLENIDIFDTSAANQI